MIPVLVVLVRNIRNVMVSNMKYILGSSSKWRQSIMDELGFEYTVISPDIDEKNIRDNNPDKLVLKIAEAKFNAIRSKITDDAIIITCDQVVVCNGEIREKPVDENECKSYLRSYAIYPAETHSGIVVYNNKNNKKASGVDIAKVYFSTIPEDIMKLLIEKKDVLYSAGGFISEDPLLDKYVNKIEGTIDSLMGLPKELLIKLLKEVE